MRLHVGSQFYSWYIYPENDEDFGKSVSSAEFIQDVNQVCAFPHTVPVRVRV